MYDKGHINNEIISQSNGIEQGCENQRFRIYPLCEDVREIKVCGGN